MGVWRDSSQPRFEETGVIGYRKRRESFKTGGSRRHGFVCSLDLGRLMGVPNAVKLSQSGFVMVKYPL